MTVSRATCLVGAAMALLASHSEAALQHAVSYTFGAGVTAAERTEVQEALAIGEHIFLKWMGRSITTPLDVYIFDTVDGITDAYMAHWNIPANQRASIRQRWAGNCAGEAGNGALFQCTLANSWTNDSTGLGLDVQHRKGILHEYVHNLQWEGTSFNMRPVWLVEGMAEYLTFIYLEQGGVPHSGQMSFLSGLAAGNPTTLADHEEYDNFNADGINLAILGVHVLVLRYGIRSLMDFFDDLKSTGDWRTSFASVFGLTHTQFYSDFESIRASGFDTGDNDFDGIPDGDDPDDDNDLMTDVYETANGLDRLDPIDVGWDDDGDNLTNLEEAAIGTDADDRDSDGDGFHDGIDPAPGVASNHCNGLGADVVLADLDVSAGQTVSCATAGSVEVSSSVRVAAGGELLLLSPAVRLNPALVVPLAARLRTLAGAPEPQ